MSHVNNHTRPTIITFCQMLKSFSEIESFKCDYFDFDKVNVPFLDDDLPRRHSYGVYISQLIRFARVCGRVTYLYARNKSLTAELLQQGYRYHKLRKTFSKFYRRHNK